MQNLQPLDHLPLWVMFAATLMSVCLAVEIGYRIGGYRRRLAEPEKETTVGAVVAATLGLLAFLLAFTFGMAASRFDERRRTVVDEANAIGTTYLRAGFLAEPIRGEVRTMLREYVDVRLQAVESGDVSQGAASSTRLHDRIWKQAEIAAAADPRSVPVGLFVQSLNETIDLHSRRMLVGVRSRIPTVIWLALFLVAYLAMSEIGYHAGLAGSRRSLSVAAMVVTFALVMLLIADLDRPREGLLEVSQQAMLELRQGWGPPPAAGPP